MYSTSKKTNYALNFEKNYNYALNFEKKAIIIT